MTDLLLVGLFLHVASTKHVDFDSSSSFGHAGDECLVAGISGIGVSGSKSMVQFPWNMILHSSAAHGCLAMDSRQ